MPADLSPEEALEREREQMVFAMMALTPLGNVIPSEVPEANRRLDAYRTAIRATLLASLIEKVEAERPVLTTASTVVDAAYHEAYCRFLTLLRTEAEADGNV